ncbi:MAG: NAD(P)-dependent oxidoreductase [Deltaproteobacteria bacterium]|nr:NAD(P)-dependent oxidoreductase [Deltaproteobacteria bacterium]
MKVAFIGTGRMGRPMAERVLAGGHELTVYNRNREKAEPLSSLGAEIASSAADAIGAAECVILMLADGAAIKEVLFRGSPKVDLTGRTVIQMGTISPSESMDFQREVGKRGGDYLEAPVLGSTPEASAGKLLVMVGASKPQFDKWSNLLECFGSEPLLIGEVGKAAAVKLALNQLIASLTVGFASSVGLVQNLGIEPGLFMKILRRSALYAPIFDKKLEHMLDRDYGIGNFPTKHLFKDVALFHTAAQRVNLESVAVEAIQRLLEITLEQGYAEADYSALFEAVCPLGQQTGGS